jgi:hypothetical protein
MDVGDAADRGKDVGQQRVVHKADAMEAGEAFPQAVAE